MCFLGWIYELLAVVAALLSAFIGYQFNIPNIHFPDVILMFVVIPFIHLLNDEDTKNIIFEHGWVQGIKYVFGIYKDCRPGENVPNSGATETTRKDRNVPHRDPSPIIANLTTSQRHLILRKCESSISLVPKNDFLSETEKMHLKRCYSFRQDVFPGSFGLIKNEKTSQLQNTLARRVSTKLDENEIQANISTQSSHSSLSIIYIDD